jgi:hypothetical protein
MYGPACKSWDLAGASPYPVHASRDAYPVLRLRSTSIYDYAVTPPPPAAATVTAEAPRRRAQAAATGHGARAGSDVAPARAAAGR